MVVQETIVMIGTVLLTLMIQNAIMTKNTFYTLNSTASYERKYGSELTDIPQGLEDLEDASDEENV